MFIALLIIVFILTLLVWFTTNIDKKIEQSLNKLQSEYIDILLLHEFEYLKNTIFFDKLLNYKKQSENQVE